MSTTITETIERQCCDFQKDMIEYRGLKGKTLFTRGHKIWFCKHCGQPWHLDKEPGDMDSKWIRLRVEE